MTEEKHKELENILRKYYPEFDLDSIPVHDIIKYMKRDKKRVGKDLTMILCMDIGNQIKCDNIKEIEIKETIKEFL